MGYYPDCSIRFPTRIKQTKLIPEKSKHTDNRILIIDDDVDMCFLLQELFKKEGFKAEKAFKGETGLSLVKEFDPDIVLQDFRLPDREGLELLEEMISINPKLKVLMITGYSDVNIAVKAIKKGAIDYITKPLIPEEIHMKVLEALDQDSRMIKSAEKAENQEKEEKATGNEADSPDFFIKGNSKYSKKLYKNINLVAPTDLTVVISGETGSGKEIVARMIHSGSKRADKPFVAVDCGALMPNLAGSELFGHKKGAFTGADVTREGMFVEASGGTLFLDEIGNLEYDIQVQLLRVLQERKVRKLGDVNPVDIDIRLIVASNEALENKVKEGKFREDLFYRLQEFKLQVPPLRDRGEDIMRFANLFLKQANEKLDKRINGYSDSTHEILKNYHWPGNLREMKNTITRAVLLSENDLIEPSSLPPEIVHYRKKNNENKDESLKSAAQQAEYDLIMKALLKCNFNKTKAAEELNIDRKTLYNKMKTLGIK